MKHLSYLVVFFTITSSFALSLCGKEANLYYGQDVSNILKIVREKPTQIAAFSSTFKATLTKVLASSHIKKANAFDQFVESCEGLENCKSHKVLGYKNARIELFGKIHLQSKLNDAKEKTYFIKDIYCLKDYTNEDMPASAPIGDGLIPEHTVLNTEHVWPKSRFKNNVEKETGDMYEMKVSDLHILYPSDEDLNSMRSNYEFAEVKVVKKTASCSTAKLGYVDETENSKLYFEPPKESRGNVARSLFYFSVRYNVPINDVEEAFLRKWDKEDPIDVMEVLRNTSIADLENVRNPFIDYPSIAGMINNF